MSSRELRQSRRADPADAIGGSAGHREKSPDTALAGAPLGSRRWPARRRARSSPATLLRTPVTRLLPAPRIVQSCERPARPTTWVCRCPRQLPHNQPWSVCSPPGASRRPRQMTLAPRGVGCQMTRGPQPWWAADVEACPLRHAVQPQRAKPLDPHRHPRLDLAEASSAWMGAPNAGCPSGQGTASRRDPAGSSTKQAPRASPDLAHQKVLTLIQLLLWQGGWPKRCGCAAPQAAPAATGASQDGRHWLDTSPQAGTSLDLGAAHPLA